MLPFGFISNGAVHVLVCVTPWKQFPKELHRPCKRYDCFNDAKQRTWLMPSCMAPYLLVAFHHHLLFGLKARLSKISGIVIKYVHILNECKDVWLVISFFTGLFYDCIFVREQMED